MPDLKEYINSKNIKTYIESLPKNITIDEALFPFDKQAGIMLEYAKGSKNRPVVLRQSTFDVSAKRRALKSSINIERKEMPFFKESIGMTEQDRRNITLALAANNQDIVKMLLTEVFDNYNSLVEGGLVQATRMRAQLIQTGKINMVSDDGDIVIDYNAPEEHKEVLSGTHKWTDHENSNPIDDLKRWKEVFVDKGLPEPTRMLLTKKTFKHICANKFINDELKARTFGQGIVTDKMVKDLISEICDLEIGFLGGVYNDGEIDDNPLYKDNIVTLIPKGTLGKTVYGTTPEEFDLMSKGTNDVQIVHNAIAITTIVIPDPVQIDTKVSMVCLPSFEKIDYCFFATVGDVK